MREHFRPQTAGARASGLGSNWSDGSRSRRRRGERLQRETGTRTLKLQSQRKEQISLGRQELLGRCEPGVTLHQTCMALHGSSGATLEVGALEKTDVPLQEGEEEQEELV